MKNKHERAELIRGQIRSWKRFNENTYIYTFAKKRRSVSHIRVEFDSNDILALFYINYDYVNAW